MKRLAHFAKLILMTRRGAPYIIVLAALLCSVTHAAPWTLRQLTTDNESHHFITVPGSAFSGDGQWICFDRNIGSIRDSSVVGGVNSFTGALSVLYDAQSKPGVGPGIAAACFFPGENNRVVFIHGPSRESHLTYERWRRFGAIVDLDTGDLIRADARDTTPPYTPGALRGGTHVHVPGGPGNQWIGFTYNDMVMTRYGESVGEDWNLRTIGVTCLAMPVTVDTHPENWSGSGFSVVLVSVSPNLKSDADELHRAEGDVWIGRNGYLRNGTRQLARAFVGTLANGKRDVFIVDIPEDITKPGPLGPLEGTTTSFPAPPAGAHVRRLTNLGTVSGYVRSDSNGTALVFQAQDEHEIPQLFTISPTGVEATQLTSFPDGIASDACWHPSDKWIAVASGVNVYKVWCTPSKPVRLTAEPLPQAPRNLSFSPDGTRLAFNMSVAGTQQILVLENRV
jgi:uncharacterized protein DUF3748/WD40 repeat protein